MILASGLKVDGVYRRCGLVSKVSQLVEALTTSPSSAPLEKDEQGILDTASALKQFVRMQDSLIPLDQRKLWVEAAGECPQPLNALAMSKSSSIALMTR